MQQKFIGLDVGGSHITIARVLRINNGLKVEHYLNKEIDSSGSYDYLINLLVNQIEDIAVGQELNGIGFSVPGPFNYAKGIAQIKDLNKYDSFFGADLKHNLLNRVRKVTPDIPITFLNDAQAFLLGGINEYAWFDTKVLAITIGTGLGSAFYDNGKVIQDESVPNNGFLYNMPYLKGMAEDYLSAGWIVSRYEELTGKRVSGVRDIAGLPDAKPVFDEFGEHLAGVLSPIIRLFNPDKILFGGNILKAFHLFKKPFYNHLSNGGNIEIQVADDTSLQAVKGAVAHNIETGLNSSAPENFRKSPQSLLPVYKSKAKPDGYDIFPAYQISPQKIFTGFNALADWISKQNNVIIDGMSGVLWQGFVDQLNAIFRKKNLKINWFCIDAALKEEDEIKTMIRHYTGENDPVFGHIYSGDLRDFFYKDRIDKIQPAGESINIIYGTGAGLASWEAPVIWLDVPKNEIQYRSRAGRVLNIGASEPDHPKQQYKRFYYVDWVVLRKHKENLLPDLDVVVDEQRGDEITWMKGLDFREALKQLTQNVFRVRPWFEPGAWGGHWIKNKISGLSPDVPNYAWSFELITPENGIILTSSLVMLEFGFEFLMIHNAPKVLGTNAAKFGKEFPVRFDFLDTFDGGNLSLQCHPRHDYIRENFGESFTQDETYYILDAKEGATVYLGFQEDIDKDGFKEALDNSEKNHEPLQVTNYVQRFPAKIHDLFLIPNGTVHCSGVNNMVLEISSTPYIYTFKMYDWLRLDLDGQPRPLNIQRAFDNLDFNRKGKTVEDTLISREKVIASGEDWQIVDLPTHSEHFYGIHRIEWDSELTIENENGFHALNLVEGKEVLVITNDYEYPIRFAETFVVPAGAASYSIINRGETRAKLVKAFVK